MRDWSEPESSRFRLAAQLGRFLDQTWRAITWPDEGRNVVGSWVSVRDLEQITCIELINVLNQETYDGADTTPAQ
jgi:hypothetical protein